MPGYRTVEEIKAANNRQGLHWFDPDTTQYHGSRVETGVIGDFYFVESSFDVPGDDTSSRIYRAVAASPDGDIQYLGGTQDRYGTVEGAIARIQDAISAR